MSIAQHRHEYLQWNSGVVSSIGEFVGIAMRQCGTDWKNAVKTALTHPDSGNWRRDMTQWQGIIVAGQTSTASQRAEVPIGRLSKG